MNGYEFNDVLFLSQLIDVFYMKVSDINVYIGEISS